MDSVNSQRLVEQFIAFAKIQSPSLLEGEFAALMAGELEKLGFVVEFDRAGEAVGGNCGNIIATLEGDNSLTPLLLCCHMDTVQPCENIKPQIAGDKIVSDGTTILSADDKAGIAIILEAVRQLQEKKIPHGLLQVVLTIGEEIGMFGAKNLDYAKLKANQALVLDAEGSLGTIVVQGPAKDSIKAVVRGKSAHAGLHPEDGISAIQVAAHAIEKMRLLRIDAETTANLGAIKGGGATNIVADTVEVTAEARSLSNEKLAAQSAHLKECFSLAAADYGATAEVEISRSYSAFSLAEDNSFVLQCCNAIAGLGLTPKLTATGGGSDCNIFNANGITALDLAIGMANPHTKQEYICISDLEMATRIILAIIKNV